MAVMAEFVVRCEDELRDQIAATAKREDRSMAAVVREAMRQYVAEPSRKRSFSAAPKGGQQTATAAPRPPKAERVPKPPPAASCQHFRRIGNYCPDCQRDI